MSRSFYSNVSLSSFMPSLIKNNDTVQSNVIGSDIITPALQANEISHTHTHTEVNLIHTSQLIFLIFSS